MILYEYVFMDVYVCRSVYIRKLSPECTTRPRSRTHLRPQIRAIVKLPVPVVREGGGAALPEDVDAVGSGEVDGGSGVSRAGGAHSGETEGIGGPPGHRVGDSAAPLDDEREAGESQRENGEEEEEAGCECGVG